MMESKNTDIILLQTQSQLEFKNMKEEKGQTANIHDSICTNSSANISLRNNSHEDNDEEDAKSLSLSLSLSSDASDVEIAQLVEASEPNDVKNAMALTTQGAIDETKQLEKVRQIIETAKSEASTSIDLSKRKLRVFPDTLQSSLPLVEYMYLEGNEITSLPVDFFRTFSRLRWLDVRNNQLESIPSAHLSSHTCLRNLLLEGNRICILPLELGLVKTLHGLNIAGNPLNFPPAEIISRGTESILCFLRDFYQATLSHHANLELKLSSEDPAGCDKTSLSSDDWNTTASMMELTKKREEVLQCQFKAGGNLPSADKLTKGTKVETKSSAPQRSRNSTHPKSKAAVHNTMERTNQKVTKALWQPTLPTQAFLDYKMKEEKNLAKVRELKKKIEAVIQKAKDEAALKNWREDAKVLQRRKYVQRLVPGKDYLEPGAQAPFGIEAERMKILSKEESLKAEQQKEKEAKLQRQMLPAMKLKQEEERQCQILELEKRILDHTEAMLARKLQPKGSVQDEVEIARRELQRAEELHRELLMFKLSGDFSSKLS